MKSFIDNRVMQKVELSGSENILIEASVEAGISIGDEQILISFGWTSLLKYLGMESLFEKFPEFNEQNELFAFIVSAIAKDGEEELLIRLYEQVFVECLTYVKAVEQIHPSFIISEIQRKRSLGKSELFSCSLDKYESLFVEKPYETIHDLTLYLAWDRVCVNLTKVFECVFPDLRQREGLRIIKECLVESFHHITAHGRTKPSFFRLIEALYAYQMREENLQTHTDEEWLILCQGLGALRSRGDLIDVFYIDATFGDDLEPKRVFTLDLVDEVKACLSLGQYMVEKLKREVSSWQYDFCPMEIVCLKECAGAFSVEEIVYR